MTYGYSKAQQLGHRVKAKKARIMTKSLNERTQLFDWLQKKYGHEVCEVCISGLVKQINGGGCIDPAHRHERVEYHLRSEMLWDKNQVILCCRKHHDYLDHHKDERDYAFEVLRGKDLLYEQVD